MLWVDDNDHWFFRVFENKESLLSWLEEACDDHEHDLYDGFKYEHPDYKNQYELDHALPSGYTEFNLSKDYHMYHEDWSYCYDGTWFHHFRDVIDHIKNWTPHPVFPNFNLDFYIVCTKNKDWKLDGVTT